MFHIDCINIFKKNFKAETNKNYDLKYIKSENDDSTLGKLEGVQFESNEKGGHLYFYSSGTISYHVFDFINDVDLVEDTLIEKSSINEATQIIGRVNKVL